MLLVSRYPQDVHQAVGDSASSRPGRRGPGKIPLTLTDSSGRRASPARSSTRRRPGESPRTQRRPPRAGGRALGAFGILLVVVLIGFALSKVGGSSTPPRTPAPAPTTTTTDPVSMTPMQARIVSIARSQIGYSTDPSTTYCNKYSAFWGSGNDDCGNSNVDEELCDVFAAWVWQKPGATVNYQYINGDLNSSAASF